MPASGRITNILLTGMPGTGKTTLIQKLAEELREHGPRGFFTAEIRSAGTRTGFRLASLDGQHTGILAHRDISGPDRVGSYGVDVAGFERFLRNLSLQGPLPRLAIIDEIGKMECLSARFRELASGLLDAEGTVVFATIARKGGGFIDDMRNRSDVLLREIMARNRDALLPELAGRARTLLAA